MFKELFFVSLIVASVLSQYDAYDDVYDEAYRRLYADEVITEKPDIQQKLFDITEGSKEQELIDVAFHKIGEYGEIFVVNVVDFVFY